MLVEHVSTLPEVNPPADADACRWERLHNNIRLGWWVPPPVAGGVATTYYVRKTGSDSNAGTSAGAAFLTLSKLAATMAGADTGYVGAGTYREANISLTNNGSAGNVISIVADSDGSKTGDPGDVIWSTYTTNDKTAAANNACLVLNGKTYVSVTGIQFIGGRATSLISAATTGSRNITFTKCGFINLTLNVTGLVNILLVADVNGACLFDACYWVTGPGASSTALLIQTAKTNTAADYDSGWTARNCVFCIGSSGISITGQGSGSGTNKGGGGLVSQCTFLGGSLGVSTSSTNYSPLYPIRVVGCYQLSISTSFQSASVAGNAIVEDYNLLDAGARSSVGTGPNSVLGQTYSPMLETFEAPIIGRFLHPFLQPKVGGPALGWLVQSTQIAVGIPTTAADDATVGTIAWTNPNNALLPDSSFATNVLLAGTTGHYLKLTGFGFAIPSSATIIQVKAEIYQSSTVSTNAIPNSVKLVKGGTISGNDNVAGLANPTGSQVIAAVGSAGDLWGLALAPSDVNASNFGIVISYKDTSGSAATADVDYVRLIVSYTDTTIPAEHSTDFTGWPRPAGGQPTIAAGAFERGDTAVQETSTVHTGSNAGKIAGPGYHRFRMPVDSGTTYTPSVYLRYDGSYGGSALPLIGVANGAKFGVTDATASQVGASNTWEKVTLGAFTPTSSGFVTIYYRSQSTAAAGNVYFDTFSPT